ncbi:MAG: hypothetical protein AMXMBFR7_33220 [Planctomycetota bacterium]
MKKRIKSKRAWPQPSSEALIRAATREALRAFLTRWIAKLDRELREP